MLKDVYNELSESVRTVSAFGNFEQPLRALLFLVSFPAPARSLVKHPNWIPKKGLLALDNGRYIEMMSILGAFFHISCLPDYISFNGQPDVGVECFRNSSIHPQADYSLSFTRINTVMNNLYDNLEKVLIALRQETGVSILVYLAKIVRKNLSRPYLQADREFSSSLGTFVNLSAMMLRLCVEVLDSTKQDEINPTFSLCKKHLNLRWCTADMSSGSDAPWPSLQHVKLKFNCECFFMTVRVLNLGLIKALSLYKSIENIIVSSSSLLVHWQAQAHSPDMEFYITRLKSQVESYTREKLCIEAQIISDESLIQRAVFFYQFMVDWLVGLVGGFKMPLPSTCPRDFASLPEFFFEDAMEMLIHASRIPRVLDRVLLDGFVDFIILFMASPNYINRRIRGKMAKVLTHLVTFISSSGSPARFTTFEGQQLSLEYLVRNLLKLYADMQSTVVVLEDLEVRHDILYVLRYLWTAPSHRHAWRQIAEEEEKSVLLNFLNLLINENIFFGESNRELNSSTDFTPNVLAEMVLKNMEFAIENVWTLAIITEQITAPFLLPEMVERVVLMLNFYLVQFMGPQKQQYYSLWEVYERNSMELMKQLVRVYVHLARADTENIFPPCIAKDPDLYHEQLFCDVIDDVWKGNEDMKTIEEFYKLGVKVRAIACVARNAQAALGDIPDEFIDPIQYNLMKDPVILPSGKTIDRDVIETHLRNFSTDPFTNVHLTIDKLIPDTELKAQIEEFVRNRER